MIIIGFCMPNSLPPFIAIKILIKKLNKQFFTVQNLGTTIVLISKHLCFGDFTCTTKELIIVKIINFSF